MGVVWQCTLCLALFSSFYAAKCTWSRLTSGLGPSPGPRPPRRRLGTVSGPGLIFSPAEVAIVKLSLSSDSLARFLLVGGTASLDYRVGGELVEMARNQRVLELQNQVRAFEFFDNHRNKF